VPLATPIGEVYRYTLEGAGGDPMALRSLQEWTVRPRLLRVPGVADVVSYGGLVKEIQVQPSPPGWRRSIYSWRIWSGRCGRRRRTPAAARWNTGRAVRHPQHRLFSSLADVGATRVATHEGTPVFVRDVGHHPPGLGTPPGRRQPRHQLRLRRGHRADAAGREPVGGVAGAARTR
jgi:cobalt-zinc-cadmium resistance protein CzcA